MISKKILFITPFPPSFKAAGEKYTKLLLEELAQNNSIDLIHFYENNSDPYNTINSNINIIRRIKLNKFSKIINAIKMPLIYPLFSVKFSFSLLFFIKRLMRKNNYDFIYFDFSQMFLYAKFITHKNKILMSHDIIYQRVSRESNMLVTLWSTISEKFCLNCNQAKTYTFSEKDSRLLMDRYNIPSESTSFFLDDIIKNSSINTCGNYFVFFAMWSRPDNYKGLDWFLDNVADSIRNDIKIKIIGSSLPSWIQDKISHFGNIEYLGYMQNPYNIIANSKGLISPLFNGAGVKVKVIESLSCGTPVIGSKISFEGIEICKESCFIAETVDEYINTINSFIYSKKDKLKLKANFINSYNNKPILRYINN